MSSTELSSDESSTPIEGIIFDLDGTLIDYEGASHEALHRPLARRGKALSWNLHAQIVGTKPEDWSRNVLAAVGLLQTTDSLGEGPTSRDALVAPQVYAREYFDEVSIILALSKTTIIEMR
jgi:beta-phosphoglucomutase-like phosphatase (HAD superfamily)